MAPRNRVLLLHLRVVGFKGHTGSAKMTVSRGTVMWGAGRRSGFRAVLRLGTTRTFGAVRPSISEAVEALLETFQECIPRRDRERAREAAAAAECGRLRRERALPSATLDSAATAFISAANAQRRASAGAGELGGAAGFQPGGVHAVHQIYGIFGDGKPMGTVFKTSQ